MGLFSFLRNNNEQNVNSEPQISPDSVASENTTAKYSPEVLEAFQNEMQAVYDKLIKGDQVVFPYGFPQNFDSLPAGASSIVDSPDIMIKRLTDDEQFVRKYHMGIGGNEYIEPIELKHRVCMRLSAQFYSANQVNFPGDSYDYYEQLAQMDYGDALEWYPRVNWR